MSTKNAVRLLVVVLAAFLAFGCVIPSGIRTSEVEVVVSTVTPGTPPDTEQKVAPEGAREGTPTPEAPETVVETVEVSVATGITEFTVTEYLSDTTDVGSLITVLNQDWNSGDGSTGEWTAEVVIQCDAIIWADLGGGIAPEGAEVVRAQGSWGVFRVAAGYTTPKNTAGRWICITH